MTSFGNVGSSKLGVERRGFDKGNAPEYVKALPTRSLTRQSLPGVAPGRRGTLRAADNTPPRSGQKSTGSRPSWAPEDIPAHSRPHSTPPAERLPLGSLRPPSGAKGTPARSSLNPNTQQRDRQRSIIATVNEQMDHLLEALDEWNANDGPPASPRQNNSGAPASPRTAFRLHRDKVRESMQERPSSEPPVDGPTRADSMGQMKRRNRSVPPGDLLKHSSGGLDPHNKGQWTSPRLSPSDGSGALVRLASSGSLTRGESGSVMSPTLLFGRAPTNVASPLKIGSRAFSTRGSGKRSARSASHKPPSEKKSDYGELKFPDSQYAPLALLSKVEQVKTLLDHVGDNLPQHLRELTEELRSGLNRQHEHIIALRRENERLAKDVEAASEKASERSASASPGPSPLPSRKRSLAKQAAVVDRESTLSMLHCEVEPSELQNTDAVLMRTAHEVFLKTCRVTTVAHKGFEVSSGPGSFGAAFGTPTAAVDAALTLQVELLKAPWPQQLYSHLEGVRVFNTNCEPLWNGLRVRSGVHWDVAAGMHPLGVFARELAHHARGGETLVSKVCWELAQDDHLLRERTFVIREDAEVSLVVPSASMMPGIEEMNKHSVLHATNTVSVTRPSLQERVYIDSSEGQVGMLWIKERIRVNSDLLTCIEKLHADLRARTQPEGASRTGDLLPRYDLPAVALVRFQHTCGHWRLNPEKTASTLLQGVDVMLKAAKVYEGEVIASDYDVWRIGFPHVDRAIMFAVDLHERLTRVGMMWVQQAKRAKGEPVAETGPSRGDARAQMTPLSELPEECCAAVAIHYDDEDQGGMVNATRRRGARIASAYAMGSLLEYTNAFNSGGFTLMTHEAYLNSSRQRVTGCHVEHFMKVASMASAQKAQQAAGKDGASVKGSAKKPELDVTAAPASETPTLGSDGGKGQQFLDLYFACRHDQPTIQYTTTELKKNLPAVVPGIAVAPKLRDMMDVSLAFFLEKVVQTRKAEQQGMCQFAMQNEDDGSELSRSASFSANAATIPPPEGGAVVLVYTEVGDADALWDAHPGCMPDVETVLAGVFAKAAVHHRAYHVSSDGCHTLHAFHSLSTAWEWSMAVHTALAGVPWPQRVFPSNPRAGPASSEGSHPRLRIAVRPGQATTVYNAVTKQMEYRGQAVNGVRRLAALADGGGTVLFKSAYSVLGTERLAQSVVVDRASKQQTGFAEEALIVVPKHMQEFFAKKQRSRRASIQRNPPPSHPPRRASISQEPPPADTHQADPRPAPDTLQISPMSEPARVAPSPTVPLPRELNTEGQDHGLLALGSSAAQSPAGEDSPPLSPREHAPPVIADEDNVSDAEGITEWQGEQARGDDRGPRLSTRDAFRKVSSQSKESRDTEGTGSDDDDAEGIEGAKQLSDRVKERLVREADKHVKGLANTATGIVEHANHMTDTQVSIATATVDMISKSLSMRGRPPVTPKANTQDLVPDAVPPSPGSAIEEAAVLKRQMFTVHRLTREFLECIKQNANHHGRLDPHHPKMTDEEFIRNFMGVLKAIDLEDCNGVKTQEFKVKWANHRAATAEITNVALEDVGREAVIVSSGNYAMAYRSIPGLLVKIHFALKSCFKHMHRAGGGGGRESRPRGPSITRAVPRSKFAALVNSVATNKRRSAEEEETPMATAHNTPDSPTPANWPTKLGPDELRSLP
eukprot:TRINITY_DN16079_c0_g1_i1.p1 TRINITY_DN16079_c0_g1~~TRINITY_DN16079_c0_g1_i1.p1  ORF type:complete len:1674 (+),score=337.08 TRINITY_DN16079_c0_g1_i1:123-5144(+)